MAEAAGVDLKKFKRAAVRAVGPRARLTAAFELHAFAQLGYGLDPASVPVDALRVMFRTCPAAYLAVQTICGIVRRSDMFSVRHADPQIVAETEAWLWSPVVLPRLLAGAGRGFAYGNVTCVLDWTRRTLRLEVPTKKGDKTRRKKVAHTHFGKAFEIHPDATLYNLDEQGEILSVTILGETYSASRVAAWIWDPEFGEINGQGACQRAWLPYCIYLIVRLLRDKYLERSVDSPRLAFTPEGKVELDGREVDIPDYVVDLLHDLQGAGAAALPSVTYADGKPKYDVRTLDLPDRRAIWAEALDRCEAEIFKAFLVPPGVAALEDAGGGGARALDGMLREFIENLATFAASGLTRLCETVHAKNYDSEEVDPPYVESTDVGKAAARKVYQDVLHMANSAARGEIAMRADVPKLLDKLGIPLREAPIDPFGEDEPPEDAEASTPGRPRDPAGQREERREDSRTDEGEDDTGGDDVERDERGEQDA